MSEIEQGQQIFRRKIEKTPQVESGADIKRGVRLVLTTGALVAAEAYINSNPALRGQELGVHATVLVVAALGAVASVEVPGVAKDVINGVIEGAGEIPGALVEAGGAIVEGGKGAARALGRGASRMAREGVTGAREMAKEGVNEVKVVASMTMAAGREKTRELQQKTAEAQNMNYEGFKEEVLDKHNKTAEAYEEMKMASEELWDISQRESPGFNEDSKRAAIYAQGRIDQAMTHILEERNKEPQIGRWLKIRRLMAVGSPGNVIRKVDQVVYNNVFSGTKSRVESQISREQDKIDRKKNQYLRTNVDRYVSLGDVDKSTQKMTEHMQNEESVAQEAMVGYILDCVKDKPNFAGKSREEIMDMLFAEVSSRVKGRKDAIRVEQEKALDQQRRKEEARIREEEAKKRKDEAERQRIIEEYKNQRKEKRQKSGGTSGTGSENRGKPRERAVPEYLSPQEKDNFVKYMQVKFNARYVEGTKMEKYESALNHYLYQVYSDRKAEKMQEIKRLIREDPNEAYRLIAEDLKGRSFETQGEIKDQFDVFMGKRQGK